jgi:protein TonB
MMRFALTLALAGLLANPCHAEEAGPRPPKLKPSTWRVDYPAEAVWKEQEGRVGYRLTIDEQGNVTECVVTSSSGHALLDDATCRSAKRAQFEPALDADGTPVPGTFESRDVYALD